MVTTRVSSYNELACNLIIEELTRFGVSRFYISPGSRSTPLTLAAAKNKNADTIMHYDERGAAFAAVGSARVTGKPSVLICTSGTAPVNYFPAVVEASMDRIPLILLTADRPPELQQVGANQTINQKNLYGSYTRAFHNLLPPDDTIDLSKLLTLIDQSFHTTLNPLPGPVQLNCMFREPLAPLSKKKEFKSSFVILDDWRQSTEPFMNIPKINTMDHDTSDKIINKIVQAQHLLITVGYLPGKKDQKAVSRFCDKIDAPVYADIRSGLVTSFQPNNLIRYFDQLLWAEKLQSTDNLTVLHFGGSVISKRYLQFIERSTVKSYVHIDSTTYDFNPHRSITDRLTGNIPAFIRKLEAASIKPKKKYLTLLKSLNKKTTGTINSYCKQNNSLTEINLTRIVAQHIRNNSSLFLGSSMPVRDFDMYASFNKAMTVYGNRGVSGIDGAIASFAGIMANVKHGTAVVGDLSALHDLNSLALLQSVDKPAVLIIINNNGGGIFSFLPIAGQKKLFEKYFAAPHDFTFKQSADMFGLTYHNPDTVDDFIAVYIKAQKLNHPAIIEITSDRNLNSELHQNIKQQIISVLNG